jgi:hypothetical protein
MTVDGQMIASILNTIGINADWINSGAISIKDSNNNETLYADTVTGAVRIKASTFSLTGWSSGDTIDSRAQGYANTAESNAKNYSDGQLSSWVTTTYTSDKSSMQSQIDGKIETFRQTNDPSASWSDNTTKAKHVGDIWYCTALSGAYAGKTWQYVYENSAYSWDEMKAEPPQDVFDQIDGKAQIFTSQPTPPYSVGDLWFNSDSDDIKTCINARSSGSYTASDWEKRNKYTDDATADTAISRLETQYGTCSTGASTQTKSVTCSNFEYYSGAKITVTFTNGNIAANPKLDVNSKGAKAIYARGSALTSKDYWQSNSVVDFVYDGTYWIMCNVESQTETFNRLTAGQSNQGIYLDNGNLYINASMIAAGTITGRDFVAGGSGSYGSITIKNAQDDDLVSLNRNGSFFRDANITGNSPWTVGMLAFQLRTRQHNSGLAVWGENQASASESEWRWALDVSEGQVKVGKVSSIVDTYTGSPISSNETVGGFRGYSPGYKSVGIYAGTSYEYPACRIGYQNAYYGVNYNSQNAYLSYAYADTLRVFGTKNRIIKTNYGTKLAYCYEMTSPFFGDLGNAVIGEEGFVVVDIDPVFQDFISSTTEYFVFLQNEGDGKSYISNKASTYFVISGTPNLTVAWELKGKQVDYDYQRMDYEEEEDLDIPDYEERAYEDVIRYFNTGELS